MATIDRSANKHMRKMRQKYAQLNRVYSFDN